MGLYVFVCLRLCKVIQFGQSHTPSKWQYLLNYKLFTLLLSGSCPIDHVLG